MLATHPSMAGASTFKQGMRALAGGVTVIATQDALGTYLGLTAASVTSLSTDPPSILVCVNRSSPMAEALCAGVHFSANVLSEHQTDIAHAFGGQLSCEGWAALPLAVGFGAPMTCRFSPDRGSASSALLPSSWNGLPIEWSSAASPTSISPTRPLNRSSIMTAATRQ
jgi:flavin reductase (DIM6/NTAB) family NADH-FMN oxidoreductase RutF